MSNSFRKTVDVLGIGFGPSNIALAIANEESASSLDMHFLEAAAAPSWQPDMLLAGSDIQNNPLRDLVTPRNPKSHFTFINYLKCKGRLFEYLNLSQHYPLRKEYAQYVAWVADFFARSVSYRSEVRSIKYSQTGGLWVVETRDAAYAARALVLATGRSRNIPDVAQHALGSRVFHSSEYLTRIRALPRHARIAVLGASQSAIEINLDLMARFPGAEIHAIHRSYSFRQKDTSPFSDYVYFPEFIDYFQKVDEDARVNLRTQLRGTNYSAADKDVLDRLMLSIYEERLDGRQRVYIHNNTLITRVDVTRDGVTLDLQESHLKTHDRLDVDALVLATGFKDLGSSPGFEPVPALLGGVAEQLRRRVDGVLEVQRDYRVAHSGGAHLYLNGMCESSHGLGDAGSFSLLSLRASDILESLQERLAVQTAVLPPSRQRAELLSNR